ncbi:hypothetical protein [Flavobacterium sp. JP2137]|uniref:hypothetical protein n=1 Tax=Flavobacterium sp. JP2137 TaxID=3414510 RepID=UPI003D2FC5E6
MVKLDFYRSEIALPKGGSPYYVMLYMDFRDRFLVRHIDVFKRKCLSGRVVERQEFENFWVDFYNKSSLLSKPALWNTPNLILGMLVSAALIVRSVVEQNNTAQELLFLIGVGSLLSLIAVIVEKARIQQYDYDARITATACAFFLAICFVEDGFAAKFLLLAFNATFLLKSFAVVKSP